MRTGGWNVPAALFYGSGFEISGAVSIFVPAGEDRWTKGEIS